MMTDDSGNQVLHFTFPEFPPFGTKIITIQADLMLSDKPNRVSVKNKKIYLQPEKYCESDNSQIIALAKTLSGATAEKTAKNIFNWVANNVKYTGYEKKPRGALFALNERKGDCTEFTSLFVALCRVNGIPSRGIGGQVAPESAILKPSGFHNWAEFYVHGSWYIVDPQKKVFMQNSSDYIALQIVGEPQQNSLAGFRRFWVKDEGLKAVMEE